MVCILQWWRTQLVPLNSLSSFVILKYSCPPVLWRIIITFEPHLRPIQGSDVHLHISDPKLLIYELETHGLYFTMVDEHSLRPCAVSLPLRILLLFFIPLNGICTLVARLSTFLCL